MVCLVALAIAAAVVVQRGGIATKVTPETLYPGVAQQHGDASYGTALAQAEGERIDPTVNVVVNGSQVYLRHDRVPSDCADQCAVLTTDDAGQVSLKLPIGYLWYGNYGSIEGELDPIDHLTYWSVPQFASLKVDRGVLDRSVEMPLALERFKISSLATGQVAYISSDSLRRIAGGFVALPDGWAAWERVGDDTFTTTPTWRAERQADGSLTVCLSDDGFYLQDHGEGGLQVNVQSGC